MAGGINLPKDVVEFIRRPDFLELQERYWRMKAEQPELDILLCYYVPPVVAEAVTIEAK